MPRSARIKSNTGIYHVMLRGINRQQIFYDDEDYGCFLSKLKVYKEISHYQIYAYCLMGNHVHILIKVADEPLETIFRRVSTAYVYWYNLKYQRTGHLFHDRYRSEAVEDDKYFLTVLRYILRNPVKAGMCSSPSEYEYSSFREYAGQKQGITDIDFAVQMTGREELLSFINQENEDQCLELSEKTKAGVTDSKALELIRNALGNDYHYDAVIREQDCMQLIASIIADGVSIRQLSRLSGIPKSRIERALKQ